MHVDCRLVSQYRLLFRSVCDTHNVDVAEFGSAFTPIRMRHDVVAADFASRIELAPDGDCPMEERVIARDGLTAFLIHFDVFEKRREPADHLAFVKRLPDALELVERHTGFGCPSAPDIAYDFTRFKFALDRGEHTPFKGAQLYDVRILHDRKLIGA